VLNARGVLVSGSEEEKYEENGNGLVSWSCFHFVRAGASEPVRVLGRSGGDSRSWREAASILRGSEGDVPKRLRVNLLASLTQSDGTS